MSGIELRSQKMRDVYSELEKYAFHSRRCILLGPSGTGKEYAARHFFEEYKKQAAHANVELFTINCAGLTVGTAQSELFGHVKGSFTGAYKDREGLFSRAVGNVLFLDEIGDIPGEVMSILLRALDPEHGEASMVGSNSAYSTKDIMIISATEKPVSEMRMALLARFDKQVFVPGLDERQEDIEPAVAFFAKRSLLKCADKEKLIELSSQIAPEVARSDAILGSLANKICEIVTPMAVMRSWPANFRALSTTIDSAIVCAERHDNYKSFIDAVIEQFEEHAPRYSHKLINSEPVAVNRVLECEMVSNDVELLRRQLLSILPLGTGREDESLGFAEFLVAWKDQVFVRRDLEEKLPDLSTRTLQARLKRLVEEHVIEIAAGGAHRYVYAPESQMLRTAQDFLGLQKFLPPIIDDSCLVGDYRLAGLQSRITRTGRLFISGENALLRTSLALIIARQASPSFCVSYVLCEGGATLEHLLDVVEETLISNPDGLASTRSRKRSFEERIAYSAGFISARCRNDRNLLVVDNTERLIQGEHNEQLAALIRAWPWFTFILCGEKMPNELAELCSVVDI